MYDDIWDYEHGDSERHEDDRADDRRDDRTEDTRDARRDEITDTREDKVSSSEESARTAQARREEAVSSETTERVRESAGIASSEETSSSESSESTTSSKNSTFGEDVSYDKTRTEDAYDRRSYRPDRSYIPEEPGRRKRKKSSLTAKIAGITAGAVLFGSVAGLTMFGVNVVTGNLTQALYPTVKQSETVALSSAVDGSSTVDTGVVSVASNLDVSAIVKEAMPSVVAITNTQVYQSNSWFYGSSQYEGESSGSGIIIGQNDTELLIVTNNHVIEDATSLKVTFIDNTTVDAAIKGTDSESDLAVVAIQKQDIAESTLAEISIATVGDSDSLEPGQGVIAIGNALGYGQSTTVGYVSAVNRDVTTRDTSTGEIITRNMIQVDAAINPGNSGGALLNMKGEVIGINAAKYSSTDVEGVGYAIPITYAEEIIGDLMNRQTRIEVAEEEQGYLGIQGQNITQQMAQGFGMPRGVYVYKILDGGAAASSELKEKDIITKIDGTSVKSMADLQEMLTYFKGGSTVTLTVQTLVDGAYQEKTVDVTLGYRSEAENLQEQSQSQEQ